MSSFINLLVLMRPYPLTLHTRCSTRRAANYAKKYRFVDGFILILSERMEQRYEHRMDRTGIEQPVPMHIDREHLILDFNTITGIVMILFADGIE